MKIILLLLLITSVTSNHPVCNQILDSWWNIRQQHKQRERTTEWEKGCQKFKNNYNACTKKGGHQRNLLFLQGKINIFQRDKLSCTMLGANSPHCVSNPCSHYNNGKCTLQLTGGLCIWNTREEAKKFNILYGCHQNPCHMGRNPQQTPLKCSKRGIPGKISCTWCKGERKLKGRAMGCQATQLTTNAECAPVNSGIPPKQSIWYKTNNKRCQCVKLTYLCLDDITKGNYKKRY